MLTKMLTSDRTSLTLNKINDRPLETHCLNLYYIIDLNTFRGVAGILVM